MEGEAPAATGRGAGTAVMSAGPAPLAAPPSVPDIGGEDAAVDGGAAAAWQGEAEAAAPPWRARFGEGERWRSDGEVAAHRSGPAATLARWTR